MSDARHLGIVNKNGREPSVASKLEIHRRVIALHPFKTSHRIILGDARTMTAVKDESVHLIVTSPPYFDLVEYIDGEAQLGHVHNYGQFLDELGKVWAEAMRVLVPGGRLCIVVGDVCRSRRRFGRHEVIPLHADILVQCRALGFEGLATVLWYKIANAATEVGGPGAALGKPYEPNGVVKNDVEFIVRLKKAGPYRKPTPFQRAGSLFPPEEYAAAMRQVWTDIPGASRRNGHPAPFPTEIASRLIRMSSYVEDMVLDPFLGTGTTTAAAIDTHRNSIGIEVTEEYWRSAKDRFSVMALPGDAAVSFERQRKGRQACPRVRPNSSYSRPSRHYSAAQSTSIGDRTSAIRLLRISTRTSTSTAARKS